MKTSSKIALGTIYVCHLPAINPSLAKILAVKSDVLHLYLHDTNDIDSKFVEFVNEAYAAENAAADRINARIEETPFPELQQRLRQHSQETISQQNRLSQII